MSEKISLSAFIPNENQFSNVNESAALEIWNAPQNSTKTMEYRIILIDSQPPFNLRLGTRKMCKTILLKSQDAKVLFIWFDSCIHTISIERTNLMRKKNNSIGQTIVITISIKLIFFLLFG